MFRYFSHKSTLTYIHILPKIVTSYNNAPHRSLKFQTPSSVNVKNQKLFWRLQFPVRKEEHPTFEVGDTVRLSRYITLFRKGYLKTFTDEIFFIKEIRNSIPLSYIIRDKNNETIAGIYYKEELSKVT